MLITGIKSRPIYDVLHPLAGGKCHIIAGQGSGGAALLRLLEQMPHTDTIRVLYSPESFSGNSYLREIEAVDGISPEIYPTSQALVSALHSLLAESYMGTRLYLAGSESFIGTAMQAADAINLNKDEVLREHCGSFVRRVWCVHCSGYTENVTQRVFDCPHCERTLVVRDHYSRRLAAFQAVKADAEVPGELPEAEELDT
ncbi:dimethylamine monooxygenase subunit DmmA family protein [Shimwellia blattae]|uniref:Uncharacterized protein n=1 Tax=Shimwellia blattae (strain ATCC 29907 / DSM 4481 / JCM 1650 / NBRC 105725 / CDC 9005-74) TaxID=630626 RepID=I2B7W0_SHIBC|nr:dimethylamine monooxygenase subunit DmmA family protein [Shimwellia blattae]AFJ46614.1 hypothetical protein EBL_c15130 [Shimwellia blattae DSM 4481 = NBRC 105725]GAB80194.1 hypothetical protein EB105725_04_03040 [Shimwellia blattae DSM 4481 = NBRC 105725]VDY64086.1 Uncharacterised protein [Shimwellia blattae]VEC22218.1 Uncharacterised protein [Shimwellia blattae]